MTLARRLAAINESLARVQDSVIVQPDAFTSAETPGEPQGGPCGNFIKAVQCPYPNWSQAVSSPGRPVSQQLGSIPAAEIPAVIAEYGRNQNRRFAGRLQPSPIPFPAMVEFGDQVRFLVAQCVMDGLRAHKKIVSAHGPLVQAHQTRHICRVGVHGKMVPGAVSTSLGIASRFVAHGNDEITCRILDHGVTQSHGNAQYELLQLVVRQLIQAATRKYHQAWALMQAGPYRPGNFCDHSRRARIQLICIRRIEVAGVPGGKVFAEEGDGFSINGYQNFSFRLKILMGPGETLDT